MNKNKKTILFLGISLLVFSFCLFLSPEVQAQGLVPCGNGSDPTDRCTLCHLITGIKGIIDWGKNILVVIALAAITIGGVMYIVSAGNEQMMETAKNVIKQALWGFVIVLGAWLIVNTSMWLLSTNGDLGVRATGRWFEFSCEGNGVPIEDASCYTSNIYGCQSGTMDINSLTPILDSNGIQVGDTFTCTSSNGGSNATCNYYYH